MPTYTRVSTVWLLLLLMQLSTCDGAESKREYTQEGFMGVLEEFAGNCRELPNIRMQNGQPAERVLKAVSFGL